MTTPTPSVRAGDSARALPRVTLVVAVRNEEANIGACLDSIAGQDYPPDRLEVLVLDGASTDRSREIAEMQIAARPGWQLIANPRISQAAGWNIGIDRAAGDVIGIVGAHSELAPDYVRAAVETLDRTGAAMVGGPVRARSSGLVGRAVAAATSSRFGVGGATFHYAERESDVDTVYMGVSRRETYRRFRFDEEMIRNQDDELSYRLLDTGARIVVNPAIRSSYRNRATLGSLWRQYFAYGLWKVRVAQKHPRQIRPRQLIPPVFVASLAGSLVLWLAWPPGRVLLTSLAGSYTLANLAASAWVGRRDPATIAVLPAVFAILHIGYGLGFLAGLVRFRGRWREAEANVPPPA
jgi:glycosyltransferase involved in cell wall biosynthesis